MDKSPQSLTGKGGRSPEAERQLPIPGDCRCSIVLSASLQGCPPWGTLLAFQCVGHSFHQQWSPGPEGCRAKQGADLMQWLHRDQLETGQGERGKDQSQGKDNPLGDLQMASHTKDPGCSLVQKA